MADFLTIGGTAFDVVFDSAEIEEPETLGSPRLRTFHGRLRSTVRGEFARAKCSIGPLTAAGLALLRGKTAKPVVAVGGEWLGNLNASVRIGGVTTDEDWSGAGPSGTPELLYIAAVTIVEAGPDQPPTP